MQMWGQTHSSLNAAHHWWFVRVGASAHTLEQETTPQGPVYLSFFFLELKSPCTAPAFELHIILQRTRTYPLQHELCTSMSLSAEWIRCCIMRHAGTSVQKERSITIMEVVSICRGLFKLLFFLQSLQLSGALPFIMYTHGTPMRGILKSRSEHCHNRWRCDHTENTCSVWCL